MRRVALLAALGAALACRKAEQPAPPPEPTPPPREAPLERIKEQEPNDFQNAQLIPPRAVVEGSIAAPRDDDWYRISPGQGQLLALRVELSPIDAALEVYDRDRNRIARVREERIIPAVACLEACFVKVSGTSPGPYSLTVVGSPPQPGVRELEPNDRAVDANELQAGKPMQGTYLTGDDEDWYKLVLPSPSPGAFLRIELSAVEGIRPDLEVRALSDGVLLATMRDPLFVRDLSLHLGEARDAGVPSADGGEVDAGADGGFDASVPAQAGPLGYYLVVRAHGKRGVPLAPYTLTASLEQGPLDLEQEPNDDPQHATPIETTATGYLAPAGDLDWYRVHSEKPAVLRAEVTGLERADIELAVYWPAAQPAEKPPLLARVNEGGPKEGEVLPAVGVPAGDSYLLVQPALRNFDGKWVRDGEDRQHPYKLQISLSADDGSIEREPNNDVETAQILSVPASLKGWIWPRKDVDLFKFHIAAGHEPVSIKLSAVRGVDLMLRLLEIRGKKADVIGSSDAIKGEGEEQILSVPLKEGEYAVEVSSPRNKDASATQPYTLSIQ